ncbi:TonB-dependent siderophore receptor [Caulobacter sp. 17J80-11]|uniref:TonB-dependent receptor plug domain-containing protein n=1 Tax=Caulobacter sp. 17J80-11 TaxID=2763502 RepID=UPI001653B99E|nr:TonB-dependent receptor [Caulobacter sp. 17J80-11]MBC6983005.1 TonB-dependent receptor [Caulobacter sp. 17J80-11]
MSLFSTRALLLGAVSLVALASPALAQEAADRTPEDPAAVDEVVVTGTRVAGRSRLDTLAPVDVIRSEALTRQGTTELAEALSTTAPSITFPRAAAVDGTDSVRPAALRGLSPDQTLVLVNGVRRHASALVNVNGSVGRGSAAVDLNAIPVTALERVEVLRDGASAQYGSDALAGVINLRLREARDGGGASVTVGRYFTDVDTARTSRSVQDGQTVTVSGWQGLPLGADGFLTVSGEYRDREPTSRGDLDPRVTPARVTSRYGDPEAQDLTLYANAGLPLANGWEAYGWAGLQKRDSESAAFFRIPSNANNVPAIYPNGFLPLIGVEVEDVSAAAGLRGEIGGWKADLNVSYGRDKLDYGVSNTLNPTYGAASPTSFDAGGFTYDQVVLGLDLTRGFEVGLAGPLNVAWGVEARSESYEIRAGDAKAWNQGPIVGPAPGAQGFPGLRPSNEVDEDRQAIGAYVDLEAQITDKFSASAAARAEHYSDFGDSLTGKLAARYDFTPAFALRGSVSTGFRAPSLQQQYYTATSTNFTAGVPYEVGTFPADGAVARALGAQPLDAETSVNASLGAVYRRGPFELTVDAYQINIDDRIVLTDNLGGTSRPDIAALLTPFGVTQARFFINGVDTETQGVDVVARYRWDTDFGRFDLTGAANFNSTDVTRLPSTNVLSSLTPPPVLFGRVSQNIIETGTPEKKLVAALDWRLDRWGASAKATHYGEAIEPGSTAASDISSGDKTLVDLEGRFDVTDNFELALGVDNLFDVYPDETPAALNSTGTLGFTRYSPFGFNGRFAYVRAAFNW